MADEADLANDTLAGFMESAMDLRKRALEKDRTCPRCRRHLVYRAKNGVRTKFCRPCWEEEGPPPMLEAEFTTL